MCCDTYTYEEKVRFSQMISEDAQAIYITAYLESLLSAATIQYSNIYICTYVCCVNTRRANGQRTKRYTDALVFDVGNYRIFLIKRNWNAAKLLSYRCPLCIGNASGYMNKTTRSH